MTDVEQIKQKLDIVAFINEHVPLKKVGRNFRALCPFHTEKTPSFNVSPDRQAWFCFGCQKGGDVFNFLMEFEHVDFAEALRTLAQKTGVRLTHRPSQTKDWEVKDRLYQLHHLASEYYHFLLSKHKTGEAARAYLENRAIRRELIQTFMLGYAPNSWDSTGRYLQKKGFSQKELALSGIWVNRQDHGYDRFRGRLMFPIKDHHGHVVGFSGRLLDHGQKEAKYINSPETLLYSKGNTLYGIDITKEAIRRQDEAVIVEGEFDLLSSFGDGVTNVVAIKGSALTAGQIGLLKRFTTRLIFALDSDLAGDAAARRAIELADQAGFLMKVIELPYGKDPDECVKMGGGLWKKAVATAIPIYDYFLTSSFKRHDGKTIEGKKQISDELLPVFAKIENSIILAHYLRLLAQMLDLPEETLTEALGHYKKMANFKQVAIAPVISPPANRDEQLEELFLAAILQTEDPARINDTIPYFGQSDFIQPALAKIWTVICSLTRQQAPLPLLSRFQTTPAEIAPTVDRLILRDVANFLEQDKAWKELVRELRKTVLRRNIRIVSTKIKQYHGESDQEQKLVSLNQELADLTKQIKKLEV